MPLRMQRILWLVLGASGLISGCGSVESTAENRGASLEDGVYLVIGSSVAGVIEGATTAPGVVELETVPLQDQPVETLRVSTPAVVRFRDLRLRGIHLDEKNACELITFENDDRLKAFSRSHVGSRVAMVIAGKVVTSHKLRVPLESDEVQISFCTEGGGDHLYKHLREVYARMPAGPVP